MSSVEHVFVLQQLELPLEILAIDAQAQRKPQITSISVVAEMGEEGGTHFAEIGDALGVAVGLDEGVEHVAEGGTGHEGVG